MKVTTTEKPVASSTLIVPRPHSEVRSLTRRLLQFLLKKETLWVLVLGPLSFVLYQIAVHYEASLREMFLRYAPLLVLSAGAAGGLWFGKRLRAGVDRLFFKEQHHQEHLLLTLLEQIGSCGEVAEVIYHVSQSLYEAYQATPIHFFFRAEETRALKLVYSYGGVTEVHFIPEESRLRSWLKREGQPLDSLAQPDFYLPRQEQQWLEALQAQVLVPMLGKDRRLLGVITLGSKRSGQPYSANDYVLLNALAAEVARRMEWEGVRSQTQQQSQAPLAALARLEEEMKQRQSSATKPQRTEMPPPIPEPTPNTPEPTTQDSSWI